ncbi:DNA polymerase III subunit delta [Chloroflexota bacterium]
MYILLGEDDYSRNESLEEIKKSLGDKESLAINTTIMDGQQVTSDQLRTICETLPFLAKNRLIIVPGLLDRFEPAGYRTQHRRATTQNKKNPNGHKELSACISKLPESTVLVLTGGKISSKNPLFNELSKQAKVFSSPLLRGARLQQWIQNKVKEEGGTIAPGAVDLLTQLVGSNLWIMSNEINKLLMFSSGRRIETEDIKLMVSYARQANVFTMVDAILESRAGLAEQTLRQLLLEGDNTSHLLAMLARQARIIVRLKTLWNHKIPEREIRSKLGLTLDFVWQKTTEQADKYSIERIKKAYHKLLEADIAIKTGKYSGELAFNILIAELCR